MIRFDKCEVTGKAKRTAEGYIRADAIVTRAGVFKYRNADGSIRNEFRPVEEVMREDSLETLKMRPVTNGHPPALINAETAKKYQVGYTGEKVHPAGLMVLSSMVVTDAKSVRDVEEGKCELSCGYDCDVVPEKGTFDGIDYTHVQKNIKYNHVAIVSAGRAGPDVRIPRFDGVDANDVALQVTEENTLPQEKSLHLKKVHGGVFVESQNPVRFDFDPSEARDSHGRWTSGGGSSKDKYVEVLQKHTAPLYSTSSSSSLHHMAAEHIEKANRDGIIQSHDIQRILDKYDLKFKSKETVYAMSDLHKDIRKVHNKSIPKTALQSQEEKAAYRAKKEEDYKNILAKYSELHSPSHQRDRTKAAKYLAGLSKKGIGIDRFAVENVIYTGNVLLKDNSPETIGKIHKEILESTK